MTTGHELTVDERLEELSSKMGDFTERCYFASARRIANEIRRLARAEGRFVAYVRATFTQMNNAGSLLDPVSCREAAIEMISLLESEERARAIQPDLPDAEYAECVNRYSSCAYDNLGKATAEISGYNSDGVHACISEGIDVCRKTGKTQCITCFREYATDVYFSADDSEMALHYARMSLNQTGRYGDRRRMAAAKDEIAVLLAMGQLSAVAEKIERVIELVDQWHSPHAARLCTKPLITEIAYVLGQPERWSDFCHADQPPEGEDPSNELQLDEMQAVIDCVNGDFEAAIKRLAPWDQALLRKQCLNTWFLLRLRLLAAHRMAGNQREFERLGEQLQTKAVEARDWHVLRCLKHLRDENSIPAPIPVFANLDCGPFAPSIQEHSAASGDPESPASDEPKIDSHASDQESEASEVPEFIVSIIDRLKSASTYDEEAQTVRIDAKELDSVISDILACDPAVADSRTAVWLLQTISHFVPDGSRSREIWAWAKRLIAPLRQDARALNLFAKLGCVLRFRFGDELADEVDTSLLERLFRESLDLDPEEPGNFERAGDFFLYLGNMGEAERCYARSFRLDRSDSEVASKLARVYRRTDRERDALTVLDMAVREGNAEPELLWEAAVSALNLSQHEATLTYLDGYEKIAPDRPWVNQYRAAALVALERFPEALIAVERETELNPDCRFPSLVYRAACAAGMQQTEQLRSYLTELLAIPLAQVDYLNRKGWEDMFTTLWNAVEAFDVSDELYIQIQDRALASNLAPDRMFERHGRSDGNVEDVNYYRCVFDQPLDERWTQWHGRMADEEGLTSYTVAWGVLAKSEDAAVEFASEWQSRCYPLPASLEEVVLIDEGYNASTGVVWQGMRQGSR